MRTKQVLDYYVTGVAAAKALGMHQSSISDWAEFPPDFRQLQIEKLTKGALKAEPGCLDRVLRLDKVATAPPQPSKCGIVDVNPSV